MRRRGQSTWVRETRCAGLEARQTRLASLLNLLLKLLLPLLQLLQELLGRLDRLLSVGLLLRLLVVSAC